jgi:hypothetical protein
LTGVEAQQFAEALLVGEAEDIESLDLVAYSFDVKRITDAICVLGPRVRVLMDHSMCVGGRTKLQLQAAQQLYSNGCSVRVGRGRGIKAAYAARDRDVSVGESLKGIIHGKSMLVRYDPARVTRGAVCLIGSTNWTDSSTANLEFSAVLREVGEDFVRDWTAEFTRGWTASKTLAEAIQEEDSRGGLDRRSASRSASQSRRR